MALFGSFNPLISGVLNIAGQQGGLLGSFGQLGASLLNQPKPAPVQIASIASGPVMGAQTMSLAAAPQMMQGVNVVASSIQAILMRMAGFLGLRSLSLNKAMRIYRKIRRFVVDPFIIAQILGITVNELGELLVSSSMRPRRRMNVGNVKALRRAHRRVEGFHRICQNNDKLRTRRRAPSRGSRTVVKCA